MERREDPDVTAALERPPAPATARPGIRKRSRPPRLAVAADNRALIDLSAACPMQAGISICVHREPDFFALNRLEGDSWAVAVVENAAGKICGCISMARREVWIDGRREEIAYVGDLKVHPGHRIGRYADALCEFATEWCRGIRPDVPCLLTVLAGNRPMDRRIERARSIPRCTLVGTVRVHTVPLLLRRRRPARRAVSRARWADLPDMASLWAQVAPGRQFAPALDADSLAEWIALAPGLGIEDFWLARAEDGQLEGFAALWDQRRLKQLHVVELTPRVRRFRSLFNRAAPLLGAPSLPEAGESFDCLAATHVCVPGDRPRVLRDLLIEASRVAHGSYAFFTLGLDVRDPLARALRGFRSLGTDVAVYATSPDETYGGPLDAGRPIHFETALV